MIELPAELRQALDGRLDQRPVLVDSRTGQEYILIRREVYEKLRAVLRPIDRGWDDPALDVYEEYRKKP
jgi:hypothetical protein